VPARVRHHREDSTNGKLTARDTRTTPEGAARPLITVVIPTRDRRLVLLENLAALERSARAQPVEVIVASDGSADGTAEAVRDFAVGSALAVRVREGPAAGPAAARNRGIEAARAPACLFLGDDVRPTEELIDRHLRFHRHFPDRADALLGRVVPAVPLDRSAFIRWLHTDGTQFGYANLSRERPVAPENLWTANVSVKTTLLREVGGFDEAFENAACEDAELGMRLARAGMRLAYDPDAVGEHFHPTDLARTLDRMRVVGLSFRLLRERAPELDMPRPPGSRHRAKAAVLTALNLVAGWSGAVRRATWRFLCDEAQREAMWSGNGEELAPRIGARLVRIALRDPEASPELPAEAATATALTPEG
jgi:GT2 family glycosyltransferase